MIRCNSLDLIQKIVNTAKQNSPTIFNLYNMMRLSLYSIIYYPVPLYLNLYEIVFFGDFYIKFRHLGSLVY